MVLSMNRWVGKVAVVTGAASGIGVAIVKQLVESGVIVAGVDLHPEQIQEHARKLSGEKGKLYAVKADVSKEEEVVAAFKWITANLGPVHILCNNAGYAKYGSLLDDGAAEAWKKTLDTNVLGVCLCTREAVKVMRANNIKGHIVNTNSMLGHRAYFTFISVYPGSKFAVTAICDVLRNELIQFKTGIKVTSVSPGLTEAGVGTLYKDLPPEAKAAFDGITALKPEDVADGVMYALSTGEHVQVHEVKIAPIDQCE